MMQYMKSPVLTLKLGGKTINPLNIYGIHLVSDINSILPTLVFSLRDAQGSLLSSLEGLCIGTKVDVMVTEDFSEENDNQINKAVETSELATLKSTLGGGSSASGLGVAFATFYVASITDVIPERTDIFAGQITLTCVHKWAIKRNYDTRLFGSTLSNGDIIKDLLLKAKCNFTVMLPTNMYIADTDKNGKTPRYKCCVDDITFIRDYILPYTTIGSLPSFFFVTDKNEPRLQNFKQMFGCALGAKILFTYGGSNRNLEFQETIANKTSMTFCGIKVNIYSASVRIGDQNPLKVLENVKTHVVCDLNSQSGTCESGDMLSRYVLTEESGPTFDPLPCGYTLPIDSSYMNFSSKSTGIRMCRNRSFDDQAALLKNSQRKMYELFSIELISDFCGSYISVGDCVELLTDPVKNGNSSSYEVKKETTDKVHWVDGKWVVKRIEHEFDEETNEGGRAQLISRVTLVRPSFYYYQFSTSISDSVRSTLEEVYISKE